MRFLWLNLILVLLVFSPQPITGKEIASREKRLIEFKKALQDSYLLRVKDKLGEIKGDDLLIQRLIGDIDTDKTIEFRNFSIHDFIALRKLLYGSIDPPPVLIEYGNRKLQHYLDHTSRHPVYFFRKEKVEVTVLDDYQWFAFNFSRHAIPEEENAENYLQKLKWLLDFLREHRQLFPDGKLTGTGKNDVKYAIFIAGEVYQDKNTELFYPLTLRRDNDDDWQIGYFTLNNSGKVHEVLLTDESPEIITAADELYEYYISVAQE